MLSLMRKHAQSWLIKAALFIIAIVFVFWGVGSFRSDRASKVAQVNGKVITVAEYQQAYRQMTDRMRSLYGQQLDDKNLYTPEFKRKILDGIIEKKLLLDLSRTLGFQATPEELSRSIQQMAAFQENGKFNSYRYKKILEMNRITPQEFEAEQTDNLMLERVRAFLNDFIKVETEEIRQFYAYLSDEINAQVIFFKKEDFKSKVPLDPGQLKSYYTQNQSRYRTPLQVRVAYLEINPGEFEAGIAVTEKEIQEYYQQNLQKFTDPKTKKPLALDQVQDSIQTALKEEKAQEKAHLKAEELYDRILSKGNLTGYGRESKTPIKESGWMLFGQSGAGLEGIKEFQDKAFALKKGELGPILDLGPKRGFAILQAIDRKDPQPMPFEQAESRVRQDYLEEKAGQLALSEAEAFLKTIPQGKDLQEKARAKTLSLQETGFYSRFKNTPSWASSPEAQQALFSLGPSSPVVKKPFQVGPDWGILVFKEYRAAPLDGFQQDKERFSQALLQQKRSTLIEDWARSLREKAKISINQDLI